MLRRYRDPLGHWNAFFDDFATSPLDFYKDVESAVTERGLPDVTISRVEYRQAGVLSDRREYLRVRRERLVFDICAAPYGKGFFFSWWFVDYPANWAKAFCTFLALLAGLGFILKSAAESLAAREYDHPVLLSMFLGVLGFWLILRLVGLLVSEEEVLGIPAVGALYEFVVKPVTYYRIDTEEMFQASIHTAVLEAVDGLKVTKGARSLAPEERVPVLRKIMR